MTDRVGLSAISDEELIERARVARLAAYAPYSNFAVGAALLTADGRVFSACNVENASYSLTICAERAAIFKAVSEGARELLKIAVIADHDTPTPPCGCCRQMIWEFATAGTQVIFANLSGEYQKYEIKDLLPNAFDARYLESLR
jgi:cytidine deaminase